MKKTIFFFSFISILASCDKQYICKCGYDTGGPAYKKVYLTCKTENGAERRCKKEEEAGESCSLE